MRRKEILARFDDIVEFAEVETFLDTPVKHYSTGMHLRLAFAVAAHLEPEILLVDEVLAVGDAAFQRKCLGKMGDGTVFVPQDQKPDFPTRRERPIVKITEPAIAQKLRGKPAQVELFLHENATNDDREHRARFALRGNLCHGCQELSAGHGPLANAGPVRPV